MKEESRDGWTCRSRTSRSRVTNEHVIEPSKKASLRGPDKDIRVRVRSPRKVTALAIKVPPIKTLSRLKEKESRLGVSTRSPDIASWVSFTADSEMLDDESEGNDLGFVWHRDIETGEWTEALAYASRQLLTSRTSVRIAFLLDDLATLIKKDSK